MKALIKWLAYTAIGAGFVHLITVWAVPYLAMQVLMTGASSQAGGYNHLLHSPRIDETSRTVVRPAPDLAYSICPYDVSDAVIQVRLPANDHYSSVSMFTARTDNFFALNDLEVEGAFQEVWLMRESDIRTEVPDHVIAVRAPTSKGVILFRQTIPSEADWPRVDQNRHQAMCKAVS